VCGSGCGLLLQENDMKTVVSTIVVVILSTTGLLGQHSPNCDTSCGGVPTVGTGAGPMQDSTSITNARGGGGLTSPAIPVGKSTAILGSQSYTYAVNLFSLFGRNGLDLNLTLYYNSLVWEYNRDNRTMVLGGFDSPSPGFRLDYGLLEFATDLSLGILTEQDGSKHLFVPTATANQYRTDDSTYILVQYPATAGNPVIVTYKSGLRVFYQLFDTTYQYQYRPYQIEDTNGNIISIAYLNSNSLGISTITDTVGRVIQFSYDSTGKMLQSVAQLSSSGQVFRQYNFTWAQNQIVTFNFTRRATAGLGLPPGYLTSGQTTENLLTEVTRPDGTRVVFDYVRDLNGVNPDNPDWATVKSIQEQSSNGTARYTTSYLFPAASAGTLAQNPTYTRQTVFDGVNTGTWNFEAITGSTGMVTCFETLDPMGRVQTTVFSANNDNFAGLPIQQIVSSITPGSSLSGCPTSPAQPWRTVNQAWTTDSDGSNARLTQVITILEDSSTQSEVKFNAYDSFGQVTDLLQYDFGAGQPGPLLQETATSFAILSNNIANRPSEVRIKDGGGNVISDTKYSYDETAVASVSPAPTGGTHDEVNYSASGTNARGNLTSVVKYANAAGASGAITSTFTHDELGNALSSSSGCCTHESHTFSSATQYAYPDSVSVGPSGSQLTTSFTYDMDRGVAEAKTDPNGQTSRVTFDMDDRLSTVTTADGITTATAYDDASANPSQSASSTANSLVAKTVRDGVGRPLVQQSLNGTSLVATTAFTNNIIGERIQATNPYAPNDSIVNTTYTYDPLARLLTTTPPAISSASQNPYQTQYGAGMFTDAAGSQRYGQIVTATDPAGKQRRQYTDALGRLVRVDEPGATGGQAGGSGSVSISGTEKSVSVANGGGATAGTGSVTISGTERSTVVHTHTATTASITITIGGSDSVDTLTTCTRTRCFSHNYADTGLIQFSVNASGTVVGPVQVSYNGSSTTASLAAALYAAFPSNSVVSMSNPNGTASFTLTTIATGSSANNAVYSDVLYTNCSEGDFVACGGVGWTLTLSGPNLSPTMSSSAHLSGGSDDVYTTMYDTGTVTVNVTIGGTVYSKSSTYGQTSTGASIATDLASQINADTTLNKLLVANVTGVSIDNILSLTTTATGANTADPLSVSAATTSQYFTSGSASFTPSPSGSTLTPGQNGTIYDVGTVTVSITGFTATPKTYTANYSQGSTTNTIASGIAGAINSDTLSPVTASVASGSNVVTFTSKTLGSDTNYGVTLTSATSQSNYFSSPSFGGSGVNLSGGADSVASLNAPLSTFFSYDAMGNLVKVTQGQQTRTYQYDSLGRMTASCVPETNNQCTTYAFTDFGLINQRTDPRGIVTSYAYDVLNRLAQISYSDGTPTVTYTYGASGAANFGAGQLTQVVDGSGTTSFQYDLTGRTTQVSRAIGTQTYNTLYAYSNGQLSTITYPSGRIINMTRDAVGRLSQINSNGSNLFSIGSYNAADQLLGATYGNGMQSNYTYNNQMQLATLVSTSASANVLNLTYNYGAQDNGQIQSITDGINTSQSTTYTYDELGRLKTARTNDLASANTWKLKFGYDRYGNRLSEIPVAGTANMPFSEIFVEPTTNRIGGLQYDAAGNVTNDLLHAYTYNAENKITSVDGAGSYVYDAGGLRVKKNGIVYIYDGGQVIAEYSNGAAPSAPSVEYVGPLASFASGTTTYYYSDHLSIRVLADASGTVTGRQTQYPFGELVTELQSGATTKWQFTNYQRDLGSGDSGLDYALARFYGTRFDRFTSMDPLQGSVFDPQSLNRYAYAGNDPINSSDPTGMLHGRLTCLLDVRGDCVGGNGYAPGQGGWGDSFLDSNHIFSDPFGPWVDPTKWDPLGDGEKEYDKQVKLNQIMNQYGVVKVSVSTDLHGNMHIAFPMVVSFQFYTAKVEFSVNVEIVIEPKGPLTLYPGKDSKGYFK
jgi:RHS repeat-associated protein